MSTLAASEYISEKSLLVRHLREAEFARQWQKSINLFAPFWDINDVPVFSSEDELHQAELYQLAGEFLIGYGKATGKKWQERGKDALGKAIRGFEGLNRTERVIECKMLLAVAYYYEGRISDFQTVLEIAERYFKNQKDHPVYLQIQINYAVVEHLAGRKINARFIIDRIAPLVEPSWDVKVKVLFNTQAGLVYRECGEFARSLEFFGVAYDYASSIPNLHYQSLITNCIANTMRINGSYDTALYKINQALSMIPSDSGWKAHFIDTKANIFYDKKDYAQAFDLIREAVGIFKKGDDAAGLVESLWTMVRIYFKLEMREYALTTFIELYNTAHHMIGEEAAQKYAAKYTSRTLPNDDDENFDDKIHAIKKILIENALDQHQGRVVDAAQSLGFKKHQRLSWMLKKVYKDITADFGIRRKTRSDNQIIEE